MSSYIRLIMILSIILMMPMLTLDPTELLIERAYDVSQDEDTITWHHDCSNTSEFQQVQEWNSSYVLTDGTMESNNGKLFFTDVPSVTNEYHGPVYIHNFTESFQFASISQFFVRFYAQSDDAYEEGELRVSLVDENYQIIHSALAFDNNYQTTGVRYGNFVYPINNSVMEDSYGYDWYFLEYGSNITAGIYIDENHDVNSILYPWNFGVPAHIRSNDTLDLSHEDGMRRVKYLVIEVGEFNVPTTFGIEYITLEYQTDDVLSPLPDESVPATEYTFLTPSNLYFNHLQEGAVDTYYATLSADTWNITVEPKSGLEVVIIVWIDDEPIPSGQTDGNHPTIEFTVDETQDVTIQIFENHEGVSNGDYTIKIEQVIAATTETSTSTTEHTDETSDEQTAMSFADFIILIGILLAIIVVAGYLYLGRSEPKRKSRAERESDLWSVKVAVPEFVIPQEQKHEYPEIRTVRLPTVCPSCKGPVIEENIDWTGPLQAKCNYCGHPIRAEFERV